MISNFADGTLPVTDLGQMARAPNVLVKTEPFMAYYYFPMTCKCTFVILTHNSFVFILSFQKGFYEALFASLERHPADRTLEGKITMLELQLKLTIMAK